MSTFNHIKVDFNIPPSTGMELEYIRQAYEKRHISGDGYFTKKCHQILSDELESAKVLLTTSCTHALEMSALLLNLQPGDEFLVPSFTFVSTVNAFVLRGARPIFVDIHPDTLNLNEDLLSEKITQQTRLIIPVHYAGIGCEMDPILEIARDKDIAVVEDNAHGLFGSYRGKKLGTFGQLSTLSFHETKNISCGEGGALVINDPNHFTRAEYIREKGTNRSRFFQGMVDKYTWCDIGSSYLPSEILAAVLLAQLEHRLAIQQQRKHIWSYYHKNLQDWALKNHVKQPHVPMDRDPSFHLYYLILPTHEIRQRMISFLRDKGIISVFHYLPLHLSEMGKRYGGKAGDCPVTESISERLVRLPFHYHLTPQQQEYVVSTIQSFAF